MYFLFFLSINSRRTQHLIFGQKFAWMNANFACSFDRVVARRSAAVVRRGVDYCCVEKGSKVDCCVFFVFFLSINSRWTQT